MSKFPDSPDRDKIMAKLLRLPDDPDRDKIMAKMLGHERLLRSLCSNPESRNIVVHQLMQVVEMTDKDGRPNFRDAAFALAMELEQSK